jgi:hypothetical protein
MAEAFGLAAAVANLLQISVQITQLSYNYMSDVKNAPKTQKQYLQEVSAFTDVLFRVDQAFQEAKSTGLAIPDLPGSLNDDLIQDCHKNLAALRSTLEKRLVKLMWPFQEKDLKKQIDILHRYRELFTSFLSASIL